MKRFLIVGGGIVGLGTARALRERFPRAVIAVLEKESRPGAHQSTHNSGVLHCGLYYRPGSLKARLAVEGIREMTAYCRERGIPHEICGKVVVATSEAELPRLDELLRRGAANGLQGLRRLDAAGLRRIEPHVGGLAAAQVPEEGIVDYRAVCDRLAGDLAGAGVEVRTGAEVAAADRRADGWTLRAKSGEEFQGDFLVNCAGLHCDRVGALAGERREVRIVPFRGEYYQLRPESRHLVKHLVYPVPDPAFPFLGVHFTRLVHGGVEAGPNAVPAFAREGYRFRDVDLRDLVDSFAFPGLWRFLLRHPGMVAQELKQSLSREGFCRSLRRLVPEITVADLAPGGAGVRAQAMSPQGELLQDFHLLRREGALHVLNAPSPAATASLAIGRHLAEQV